MRKSLPSLLLSAALGAGSADAATIITRNGGSVAGTLTNANIPNTFGDNISTGSADFTVTTGGTPDIDLTWSRSGTSANANAWQFHAATTTPSNGGGQLQMDGSVDGSTYSVTFTPSATTGVKLSSFNFLNDTGSSVNYYYTINVVDVTGGSNLYTTNFVFNPTVNTSIPSATVDLAGTTGTIGSTLRLDIVRTANVTGTAGSSVDIYIDNLSFDQVPEPSTALLSAFGVLALLRRRRA